MFTEQNGFQKYIHSLLSHAQANARTAICHALQQRVQAFYGIQFHWGGEAR